MKPQTVIQTVENGLCSGCGVCKGICPKDCISWDQRNGLYIPSIDETACVHCGLCASVCPGLKHSYVSRETATDTVTGTVLCCCNAWSKDPQLRHVSASGGVVSTIVRELLATGVYDGAFCLDSYDYRSQLKTRLYSAEEAASFGSQSTAPKSRYLPVSHENAIVYIRKNRSAKLIIVGTSCAIRGIQAALERMNIEKEQYLFIGLFCDKVFNYNVLSYFQDTYTSGHTLKALHFKNKESGGWPGDMKLFPENGDAFYVPLAERAKAKRYFMPERCLYCVDKLNICADISLGDNYTGKDESKLGSNSVIIRTQTGMDAWNRVCSALEIREISISDIQKAQDLEGRLDQLYFGDIKSSKIGSDTDLNPGVPREQDLTKFQKTWASSLNRLRTGGMYDTESNLLKKQIARDNRKPNPVIRFAKRAIGYIRRRLKL